MFPSEGLAQKDRLKMLQSKSLLIVIGCTSHESATVLPRPAVYRGGYRDRFRLAFGRALAGSASSLRRKTVAVRVWLRSFQRLSHEGRCALLPGRHPVHY